MNIIKAKAKLINYQVILTAKQGNQLQIYSLDRSYCRCSYL